MTVSSAVVDASSVTECLLGTVRGRRLAELIGEGAELHAPELCDVEVTSALRALVLRGRIGAVRAREALADFADLPLNRYSHLPLLPRVWALRDGVSAYDATYVALAEALGAPLLTADARLASVVEAGALVPLVREV